MEMNQISRTVDLTETRASERARSGETSVESDLSGLRRGEIVLSYSAEKKWYLITFACALSKSSSVCELAIRAGLLATATWAMQDAWSTAVSGDLLKWLADAIDAKDLVEEAVMQENSGRMRAKIIALTKTASNG